MAKSFFWLMLTLVLSANMLVCNEIKTEEKEYQSYRPFVSFGLMSNFNKSGGLMINDVCPTCIGLQKGFGLREHITAGIYNHSEDLFGLGMEYQYGISLGYTNRSSKFETDYFNGYLIRGNEVIKGMTHYNANVKLFALNATPFINLFPIKGLDLAVKVGFGFDFIFSNSASVVETALGNDVYLPNNAKERWYEEPKINTLNKTQFSLPVGLKYDIYVKNFVISPEVTYDFALNKLQTPNNWKQNRLFAGLSVAYRFEKEKTVVPTIETPKKAMGSVTPALAKNEKDTTEEKADIFSRFEWLVNNHRLYSNDTMHIDAFITDYIEELPIIPYVFFDKDSYEFETDVDFTNEEINVLQNPEYIQLKFLILLPDYITNGKVSELVFSATTDEDPAVLDKRIEFIKAFMDERGVSLDGIKISKQIIDPNKLKYIELADENRYMRVEFKSNQMEYISFLSSSTKDFPAMNFQILSHPESKSEITDTKMEVFSNEKKVAFGNDNQLKIKLSFQEDVVLEYDYTNVLRAKYQVQNADGTVKTFTDSVNLVMDYKLMPDMINARIIRKRDDDNPETDHFFEHILAIFDFDRSAVKFINEKTKEKLYDALEKKEKVEVFGSADSFGTDGYNDNLVRKRVANALKAVNVNPKNVHIITRDAYTFENSSAIGRMYNRAVMIRVYKDPEGEGKPILDFDNDKVKS